MHASVLGAVSGAGPADAAGEAAGGQADRADGLRGAADDGLGALAEHHHRPARWPATRSSLASGFTATGWPTASQHRQVAGTVAVGPALVEVEALPAGEFLDGLHLAGAVAERAGQLAGVHAVDDRAAGADAGGHAQRLGQRLDQLDRRGGDDVRGAAGVAVLLEQAHRLRAHLGHQLRHDVGVERDEVVEAHALHRAEDAVAHAFRGLVAGARELERHRPGRVAHELVRGHQLAAPGSDAEHERAGATDQRAVEVEERGARTGGVDGQVGHGHRCVVSGEW